MRLLIVTGCATFQYICATWNHEKCFLDSCVIYHLLLQVLNYNKRKGYGSLKKMDCGHTSSNVQRELMIKACNLKCMFHLNTEDLSMSNTSCDLILLTFDLKYYASFYTKDAPQTNGCFTRRWSTSGNIYTNKHLETNSSFDLKCNIFNILTFRT